MIKTALWRDVQQKAYRLLTDNDVDIDAVSTYSILCTVHGDNDTYQTYVNNDARVFKDNSISKANWYCTCPWGKWSNTGRRPHDGEDSYGTVKSNNRMCSHAYAAYLMLQQYRKVSREQNKMEDQTQDQVQDQAPDMVDQNDVQTYDQDSYDQDAYEQNTYDQDEYDEYGVQTDDLQEDDEEDEDDGELSLI